MTGEPESLHVNEPLPARIERHDYDRMLMLSDGVFAIAITLLALELPLPTQWDGRLTSLASESVHALIAYGFGFLMVGAFWLMHRRIFAQLLKVDRIITLLSLLVLGLVGLAPFVARILAEIGPARGLLTYVALLAAIMTAQVLLWAYAMSQPGLIHWEVSRAERLQLLIRYGSIAAVWGALTLWAVWEDKRLDGVTILAAAMVSLLLRRLGARLHKGPGPSGKDAPSNLA